MPDKITKFINSLDPKIRERLKEKLQGGDENVYRFRMGKIRIIYRFHKNDIEIIDIDYRGNIY